MLRNTKELSKYVIGATNGTIGHAEDFYFDDEAWVVRYLVVNTGSWLSGREVLISPIALGPPNAAEQVLPVSITREQVEHSPDIDTRRPVSRQHESRFLSYYGYPYYWGGIGLWGSGLYPGMLLPEATGLATARDLDRGDLDADDIDRNDPRHANDDVHLRSCKGVTGYHIEAADGDIGHVDGFLVDDQTWAIRFLIVNTSNWWLGHQVLVSPQWVNEVNWELSSVYVTMTRAEVQAAPPYDAAKEVNREQEVSIYDHYRRPGYWANDDARGTHPRGR
jgi:hypothetical protein